MIATLDTSWKCVVCGKDVGFEHLQYWYRDSAPNIVRIIDEYMAESRFNDLLYAMTPIIEGMENLSNDIYPGGMRCRSCDG